MQLDERVERVLRILKRLEELPEDENYLVIAVNRDEAGRRSGLVGFVSNPELQRGILNANLDTVIMLKIGEDLRNIEGVEVLI